MTLGEFKSWLDGFSAAIGDAPTPEQWALVRSKLSEATPAPVFATMPTVFRTGEPMPIYPYTTCSAAERNTA